MILCCITTDPEQYPERWLSFLKDNATDGNDYLHVNEPNIGVVPAMQLLYERFQSEDIIAFVHSDVTVYDPTWAERVRAEFDDPKVAVVGFGGATGIGVDDIYKTRYQIEQLQRINYASNDRNWPTHGSYEAGSKDVAVIDGFFMACRTSALKEIGGWKGFGHNFHMYDCYICLALIERGWKVRMVGCEAEHHGGGTSTSESYRRWCHENGTTMEREHQEPHKFIYERFRSLLPYRV
jgi:GT2 family glycosyltransferase